MYRATAIGLALLLADGARADDKAAPPHGPRLVATKAGVVIEAPGLVVGPKEPEALAKLLVVYVDRPAADREGQPAVAGKVTHDGKALRFTPRFPLQKGVRYRVVFQPPVVGALKPKAVEAVLAIPRPVARSTAFVSAVYPSSNVVPENLLRFYVHFSTPMRPGECFQYLRLLDENGREIDLPFLELDQEMWGLDDTRFTVFFDPGRIKRGLLPREELGPVLEAGKKYTLVVDKAWRDADDAPMRETFKKTFTVGPAKEAGLDEKKWSLTPPAAATRGPLRVTFPLALDHALLHRMLWVEDAKGERVEGKLSVSEGETRWELTPTKAWKAGTYFVTADRRLEDVSGNRVGRPFEVDVVRPVKQREVEEIVRVRFEVK